MPTLPPGFDDCLHDIRELLRGVEGWLSDREAQFLAMLAACPTGEGEIIEIGSFRGRSTIALAKGAALSDRATVHTVDIRPPAKLQKNLDGAGVRDRVAVYHMRSAQMLANWARPVRLLWCDGPIDRKTVSEDFDQLRPFLSNGAIVAFHDVMNVSGERIWVFAEKVLRNAHFGAVGMCGSIGWGQFRTDPQGAKEFARIKRLLHARLLRLRPFHEQYLERRPPLAARIQYKLLRSLIPHGRVAPEEWVRKVA